MGLGLPGLSFLLILTISSYLFQQATSTPAFISCVFPVYVWVVTGILYLFTYISCLLCLIFYLLGCIILVQGWMWCLEMNQLSWTPFLSFFLWDSSRNISKQTEVIPPDINGCNFTCCPASSPPNIELHNLMSTTAKAAPNLHITKKAFPVQ